ncbi:MAG: hypothetical protein RML72_12740 [Bacteroidia bacterium]|nr:hypothetical protein [Bacteroidia bacterium]MDW8159725.1 hypothetical protein [Bacteroidia bacterium]
MAKKGLDATFLHYGIRKEDMQIIDALCTKHGLDAEWVKEELLREYHEKRVQSAEIDERGLEKLIEKALQKIK